MKKNNGSIVSAVREIALPLAEELGYLLWDVEYVKEGADYFLRITIDSDEGITIDDCEKMHRAIDPLLDEADPIEESYHLEICSPGLEREIRSDEHIEFCRGFAVEARFFAPQDGAKSVIGTLEGLDADGKIVLTLKDGTQKSYARNLIASLRTYYEFDGN